MAARRRARPKERALDAAPVLRSRAWPGPGVCAPRWISGRLKARSAWRGWGAMCCSPAADGRTISHEAIYTWIHTPSRGRNLVGARDRAALTALGAQGGPRRRAQAPDRGHAVDRAGALTIDDRAVPGNWEGDLIIGKKRGQSDGRPWSSVPRATSSWWAFPRGWEGAAWCGRPHPPHPRTARRRDEHPDLGPGERNGPPPAPDRRHRDRRVLRPPPQPLGKGHEREHQPPPRAATCPKAPPSPATNPTSTPSPTNRATAPAPPSTTSPHKKHSPNSSPPPLDTTPPLWSVRRASSHPSSTPTSARC